MSLSARICILKSGDVEESQLFHGGKRREAIFLYFSQLYTPMRLRVTVAVLLERTGILNHSCFLLQAWFSLFYMSSRKWTFAESKVFHESSQSPFAATYLSLLKQASRFRFGSAVLLTVNIPHLSSMPFHAHIFMYGIFTYLFLNFL